MNHLKQLAKSRALLTQKIRDFFTQQNFTEVETPIMVPIPGMEPHLTPFETALNLPGTYRHDSSSSTETTTTPAYQNSIPLYLNTSPELQMKKLLAVNFGNIFNITKVFRNGEIGGALHNPEFTMIEWYRENADYTDIMTDCEKLILDLIKFNKAFNFTGACPSPVVAGQTENTSTTSQSIPKGQNPTLHLPYQSHIIDLTQPWPRLSTNEAFRKFCQIDLLENRDFKTFRKTAETKGYNTNGCDTWDDIYFKIFLNHIEPKLGNYTDQTSTNTSQTARNTSTLPTSRPVFLYDYPASQAALAKTCLPSETESSKNPFFAERFELYIAGIELANAFSELIDADEQRARLIEEQNLRKKLNKTVFTIDEEFLQALNQIKKPCAGIALGLDRLFMLLLDKKTIDDVLLFPLHF